MKLPSEIIPLLWTDFSIPTVPESKITILAPSGLPFTIKGALSKCLVASKDGSYIYKNGEGSLLVNYENVQDKLPIVLTNTKPGAIYGFELNGETWLAIFGETSEFVGYYNSQTKKYLTDDKDYSDSYPIFYWKGVANKDYQWSSDYYCLNPSKCKKIENYQAAGPYQNDPFCLIESSCSPTPPAVEELKAIPWAKLIDTDNEAFYHMGYIYYRYKLNSGYAFMACKYDEATHKNYFYLHDGTCWQPYSHPIFSDAPFTNLWYMCKSSGHITLDIIGSAPLIGFLADGANGLWYMAEGDKLNATICFVCAVLPTVADASIKGAKYTIKIFKGVKGVPQAYELTAEAYQSLTSLQKILKLADKPLFDEIMEGLTKLYKEFPSQAADIERLAIALNNPQKLKAVLVKIEGLGQQRAAFMQDIKLLESSGANSLAKNLGKLDEGLVDAWKMASKHADLRTNTTALSKLNDIAGRGRGIDKAKLKAALDGDLGDVMNKATGDDLTNILNKLDEPHVTGSHLDEITSRLGNVDYGIKAELLEHPDRFATFDEVLNEPGKYWDLIEEGALPANSYIRNWGQGKWWKELREKAKFFEGDPGVANSGVAEKDLFPRMD